jgi:hypothetical protein
MGVGGLSSFFSDTQKSTIFYFTFSCYSTPKSNLEQFGWVLK